MRNWSWDEGWILAATCMAQKDNGATLADIIGAADAINHTIPTATELSTAFSHLAGCGIVRLSDDRYVVAEEHLQAIRKVLKGKGGLFASADKLLKWLRRAGFEGDTAATLPLSDAEVKQAYESYRAALKQRR